MPESEKEKAEYIFGDMKKKQNKRGSPKNTAAIMNVITVFVIIGAALMLALLIVIFFIAYMVPALIDFICELTVLCGV